jgi:hypothetical protein
MKTSNTAYEVKLKPPQEGGGAFGDVRSQSGGSLPNPIQSAPGTATPPAAAPAATEPPAVQPTAPPADPATPAPTLPRQNRGPSGAHDSRMEPIPTDREKIEYAPKTTRDPVLSLLDEQKLAVDRQAKEAARLELEAHLQAAKQKQKPKPKKEVDKLITVQGIVVLPSGATAIINDEVRRQGDKVFGAVVKKITTRYVIFTYEGRSFSKEVSK